MTQLGVLNVLHHIFTNSLESNVFTLPVNEKRIMFLRATGQLIQIHSGNAWITCNGEDILLEAGQVTQLPRNWREAIISAISSATVTFEIIPH